MVSILEIMPGVQMMTRDTHTIHFYAYFSCLIILLSYSPAFGEQVAPLPDTAFAGFHPGFFTRPDSENTSVPKINASSESQNAPESQSPRVNISYFSAGEKGEKPSIAGFVSGEPRNITVNLSGRVSKADTYQFLATITPDDQGIFVWPVPEWAENLTEYIAVPAT